MAVLYYSFYIIGSLEQTDGNFLYGWLFDFPVYNNNFVPPDKTGKGENAMLVLDFYNVIIGTPCIV